MYKECRHIKPNGCKCKSPALKDKPDCYYHIRVHGIARNSNATSPYEQKELQIPLLEDRGAARSPSAKSSAHRAIAAQPITGASRWRFKASSSKP